MFGFHAISEMPLSTSVVKHLGSATLNATGSVSTVVVLDVSASVSMSVVASMAEVGILQIAAASLLTDVSTVESIGSLVMLSQANISSASAFTEGFTQGFLRAALITAHGTIDKMHLVASSSFSALPSMQFPTALSLPISATFSAVGISGPIARSSINLAASLGANSVLLIGGLADVLSANATLQAVLTSPDERQDLVKFTLYIDKGRDITSYLSKNLSVNGFVDKNSLISSYLDKQKSLTGYVDKVLERDLVRER